MQTFSNRTPKDGNFFFVPELNIQVLNQKASSLPKVLIETVNASISLLSELDSEKTLSVSNVAAYLEISSVTLNKRLLRLVKLNILERIPFGFTQTNSLRISCYKFCDSNDVFEEVTIEQLKQEETKRLVKQTSAFKREQEKKLYKQGNYAPRPQTSEILPIRQSGNFLVEQCISTLKQPIQKMAKSISIGNKTEIKAQITSSTRIMNAEDLQVLFATYSLIQKYHENSLTAESPKPINRTPIHISDIAAVRGKSTGGNTNIKIRESLESIYRTNFEFYGLGNIDMNSHSISAYMRETFSNFQQCTPLSDVNAEIKGDDVIFGKDSMIYLIKLPDDVFTELLTGKYHFVFPQASLSAPGIVFSLYLRFRSRVKNTFSENLKTTWTALSKGSEFKDFKISIKSQILKVNRKLKNIQDSFAYSSYDEKEDRLTFNLWGYHGFICFKENYLSVKCHEKEMFAACRVHKNDSLLKNAPTVENYLRTIFEPELKLEAGLPRNISKLIKSFVSKYNVTYEDISEDLQLCVYSTERELYKTKVALVDHYHTDELIVQKKIDHDLTKVNFLCFKGHTITKSEFFTIVDFFGLDEIPTVAVTKFLTRFPSLYDDLVKLAVDGHASDQLIAKFENHSW